MIYIYVLYFTLITLLIYLNISLNIQQRGNQKTIINVETKLQLQKHIVKELTSQLNTIYNLLGNTMVFTQDSNIFNNNNGLHPCLIIKQKTCDACKDALVLEIDELIQDSIKIVKDLSVVLLKENDGIVKSGVLEYFKKNNIKTYLLNINDIADFYHEKLPDMSLLLLDKKMKIVGCCEYRVNYPRLFKLGIEKMNETYVLEVPY